MSIEVIVLLNEAEKQLIEKDKAMLPMMRSYAWSYFAYHAEQRMKTLNFFLLGAGLFAGGICTLLRDGSNSLGVFVLGVMLSSLSFIFWRLDQRNTKLVEYAKDAIKYLDSLQKFPETLQIVARADR